MEESGTLFCANCGTQSQAAGAEEEEDEFDEGAAGTRFRRRAYHVKKRKVEGPSLVPVDARVALAAHLLSLQRCLEVCAEALEGAGEGGDLGLKEACRRVWASWVAKSRVLADASVQELQEAAGYLEKPDLKTVRRLSQGCCRIASLSLPLAVLYVACADRGRAPLPADLEWWARSGAVPFFEALSARATAPLAEARGLPPSFLAARVPGWASASRDRVHALALAVAQVAGVRPPPVEPGWMLRMLCARLALPAGAARAAEALVALHGAPANLDPSSPTHPAVGLAAALLAVLKLSCLLGAVSPGGWAKAHPAAGGSDGSGVREVRNPADGGDVLLAPPASWVRWARAMARAHEEAMPARAPPPWTARGSRITASVVGSAPPAARGELVANALRAAVGSEDGAPEAPPPEVSLVRMAPRWGAGEARPFIPRPRPRGRIPGLRPAPLGEYVAARGKWGVVVGLALHPVIKEPLRGPAWDYVCVTAAFSQVLGVGPAAVHAALVALEARVLTAELGTPWTVDDSDGGDNGDEVESGSG